MSGNFSMVDANNDGCVSVEEVAKNHLLVSECVFGQGSSHGSRSFDSAVTDGQRGTSHLNPPLSPPRVVPKSQVQISII